MKPAAITVGIVVAFSGLVWLLQGFGSSLAPRSFMTNNPIWIVVGLITSGAGCGLVWWGWHHERDSN